MSLCTRVFEIYVAKFDWGRLQMLFQFFVLVMHKVKEKYRKGHKCKIVFQEKWDIGEGHSTSINICEMWGVRGKSRDLNL